MFRKLYKEANDEIAVNKELMEHLKQEAVSGKTKKKYSFIYNYGYVAAAIIIVAVSLNVFSDIEKGIDNPESKIQNSLNLNEEKTSNERRLEDTTNYKILPKEQGAEKDIERKEKSTVSDKNTVQKNRSVENIDTDTKRDAVINTEERDIALTSGGSAIAGTIKEDSWEEKNAVYDAAVCEESYREKQEYSKELLDLQDKISTAMIEGELPFVISSSIVENPEGIRVLVTTKDETLIEKLKAFDSTGNLIFIEYSEEILKKDFKDFSSKIGSSIISLSI